MSTLNVLHDLIRGQTVTFNLLQQCSGWMQIHIMGMIQIAWAYWPSELQQVDPKQPTQSEKRHNRVSSFNT